MAVGGAVLPIEAVRSLEMGMDELCESYGFPPNEAFKWSPPPEYWMRENLVDSRRESFFTEALEIAALRGATLWW